MRMRMRMRMRRFYDYIGAATVPKVRLISSLKGQERTRIRQAMSSIFMTLPPQTACSGAEQVPIHRHPSPAGFGPLAAV